MADAATTSGQANTPVTAASTDPAASADKAPATLATEPVKTETVKTPASLFDDGKTKVETEVKTPEVLAAEKAVADKAIADKAEADAKVKADAEKPAELKLPEDVPLDKASLAKFGELAKTSNLPIETQQALIDLQAGMARDAIKTHQAAIAETYASWRAESLKSFTQAELNHATNAVAALGDDQIRTFFNESHLGDHPMIVRMLSRIGAALAEDSYEAGRSVATTPKKNGAELLYGPGTEKRN